VGELGVLVEVLVGVDEVGGFAPDISGEVLRAGGGDDGGSDGETTDGYA